MAGRTGLDYSCLVLLCVTLLSVREKVWMMEISGCLDGEARIVLRLGPSFFWGEWPINKEIDYTQTKTITPFLLSCVSAALRKYTMKVSLLRKRYLQSFETTWQRFGVMAYKRNQ